MPAPIAKEAAVPEKKPTRSAVVLALAACLLGLGGGLVAVTAIASAGPDDAKAATTGPVDTVAPDALIDYGG